MDVEQIIRNLFPNSLGLAWRDLINADKYQVQTQAGVAFASEFPGMVTVGTPTYTLRWRDVGKACQFEMEFQSTVSIASVAGTDYFKLPLAAANPTSAQPYGKGGIGAMVNRTTNVAVGLCVLDLTNSRCYLPAQAASGALFQVSGWYPIG